MASLQFPSDQPGIPFDRLVAVLGRASDFVRHTNGMNPVILSYRFETSRPADAELFSPWIHSGWRPFGADEKNVILNALQRFSDVANIKFTPATSGADADISFGVVDLPYNGEAGARWNEWRDWEWDAYAVFAKSAPFAPNGVLRNDYQNVNIALALHEIGHTMSLIHPGPYDVAGPPGPGPYLPRREDNFKFSVMSYNENPDGKFRPTELMLYDVAALQSRFGANLSHRVGNDVYTAPTNNTLDVIWDAGGRDLISAGASELPARIDLNAARFSSLASPDDIVIAYNVIIEDAAGGSGKDRIIGNQFDNRLRGNGGNDLLVGNGGDDWLDGGKGLDDLRGGRGNDTYVVDVKNEIKPLFSDEGIDTVRTSLSYVLGPQQENLVLLGKLDSTGTGNATSNRLLGNVGQNLLEGRDGDDWLDGGPGRDDLRGGAGDDNYVIDDANDIRKLVGDPGTDSVFSSIHYSLGRQQERLLFTGNASLRGAGNDSPNLLKGNRGSNTLSGLGGDDVIDGGLGRDVLIGGPGDDVFRFSTMFGAGNIDEIRDFHGSEAAGGDLISLDTSVFLQASLGETVLYDASAGSLSYDQDGIGTNHQPIIFAFFTATNAPIVLVAEDFVFA